jgi:hypothetical protein
MEYEGGNPRPAGEEVFCSAIGYLAGSLWVPNVGGLQEKRGFSQ